MSRAGIVVHQRGDEPPDDDHQPEQSDDLSADFNQEAEDIPSPDPEKAELDHEIRIKPGFLKDGQYYLNEDNGAVYRRDLEHGDALIFAPKGVPVSDPHRRADTRKKREKLAKLKMLIQMRDTARKILEMQEAYADDVLDDDGNSPWATEQKRLNEIYDAFLKAFGPINKIKINKFGKLDLNGGRAEYRTRPNLKKFRKDPDAPLVAGLELYNEITGVAEKAPIFYARVLAPRGKKPDIQDAKAALAFCLAEKGRVSLSYMQKLLGEDHEPEQTLAELSEAGLIFFDPASDSWESREAYLSGDIRAKLDAALQAQEQAPGFRRNIAALRKVLPPNLSPLEIDLSLGMHWIPEDFIREFAMEVLGASLDTNITYVPLSHSWYVDGDVADHGRGYHEFGTQYASSLQILEDVLRGQDSSLSGYRDQDGSSKDSESDLAAEKQEAIKRAFARWVWEDADHAAFITNLYNRRFNSVVPRKYDGNHLYFPGKAVTVHLREHQSDVAWRNTQSGNTLYAHEVGAGKTFASISACMELRRIGKSQKPLFVVPNHMLEQFSRDFMLLYPNAHLLILEDDQFTTDGRKLTRFEKMHAFVKKAKDHDWDAVFMTQSNFDLLQASPRTRMDMTVGRLREIADEIDRLHGKGLDDGCDALKDLDEKLYGELWSFLDMLGIDAPDELKLEEREEYITEVWKNDIRPLLNVDLSDEEWAQYLKAYEGRFSSDLPYFEDMGVDYLFIDEGHDYKNRTIESRHQQLSRMGSSRAQALDEKLFYLREINPGCYISLMTATPISNAISEIYSMQCYMQPEVLEAQGIRHFDAWAKMFAESVRSIEMAPEGGVYRIVERISRYKNIPELMRLFHQFADIVSKERLDLDLPDLKGGAPQTIVVPQNPAIQNFFKSLSKRASRVRKDGGHWEQISKGLDPNDLIEIDQHIRDRTEMNGDGLPYNEEERPEDNMLKIIMDGRLATLHPALVGLHPKEKPAGKIEANVAETAKRYHANKDRVYYDEEGNPEPFTGSLQMILCDLGIPKSGGQFSVYDEIRFQLVQEGVPEDQIRFIHDYTDDKKKAELFEDCRQGKVAVLIGTTGKLGTGTNVQKRLIAMHELDPPWRPTDVIQRNGRIIRQKNQNPEVEILRYVVEGSYDVYLWQTLERKAQFIHQIMRGDTSIRHLDETDSFAHECAAIKALAANNPLIFEKAEVDFRLEELEHKQRVFEYERQQARRKIEELRAAFEDAHAKKVQMDATAKLIKKIKSNEYPVAIKGKSFSSAAAAGEFLKAHLRSFRARLRAQPDEVITESLGTLYGMRIDLEASVEVIDKNADSAEESRPRKEYKYSFEIVVRDGHKTRISISQNDMRETREERAFRKAVEKAEGEPPEVVRSLCDEFRLSAEQQADVYEVNRALAGKLVGVYQSFEQDYEAQQKTVKDIQEQITSLRKIIRSPFAYQQEMSELRARQAELEKELTKPKSGQSAPETNPGL